MIANKKILIVDDDDDWREALRLSLEDLGWEILEAADGEQALEAMRRERPAFVLLDLAMPGMSGEEVARALPDPRPRVIFLTASRPQEAASALQTGPHYYLPKTGSVADALELMLSALAV